MKNILIITALFPPEPVVSARLSQDIAIALSVDNNVTVLCPFPTRPKGFSLKSNSYDTRYKCIRLKSYTNPSSVVFGRFRESFSFGKYCQKYIYDNYQNIDIIYLATWPLFAQYFVVKASKNYGIPIIIHVQDIYPESLTNKLTRIRSVVDSLLLPIDKFVLQNATKVIAISESMKKHLSSSRNIYKAKIEVIQNWQDEKEFIEYSFHENNNSEDIKVFTFMYLGNIGPVAGVDLLIKSFSQLDVGNCRLVIAGSGSMKEKLKKMVLRMKLNSVHFLDVPDGKVPEIQHCSDVMLLPLTKGAASSSIPSKLPAYMFSKKPIIASLDIGSTSERVITEAKAGWVIEPENEKMLTKTMKEAFLLDENELKVMGENGYNYSVKHFSKKNNLPKIVNIISTNYEI